MSRSVLTFFAMWALLIGCSLERYEGGGGFETPDLTARIVDTAGQPVFGARVWLVRSNGDSAPASVLDSTQTDSSGIVNFLLPDRTNRTTLGLDAQESERLGIAPAVFRLSSEARVELRETRSIKAERDSTGAFPELHVPGSHFSSLVSVNGISSTLRVPAGIWDVAIRRGESLNVLKNIPVLADTTVPGPPVFVPPDTTRPIKLADSADIGLDSFRIGDVVQYADTTFPSVLDWAKSYIPTVANQIMVDSIGTRLGSNWIDSTGYQGFTRVASPLLRDTGTLAIQLAFPGGIDTSLLVRLQLFDTTTSAGVRANAGSDLDSIGVFLNQYSSPSFVPLDASRFASDNIWYFSWTRDSVVIRTSNGIRGRTAIPETFSGPLRFSIFMMVKNSPASASMWIKNLRLYKPR